jgi:hypothetical protein
MLTGSIAVMRILKNEDNPSKQRVELIDVHDAEAADRALHDYHHNVKGYKSHLAESSSYPLLLGFVSTQHVIEGLGMRYLTVEEVEAINARKRQAGSGLAAVAVASQSTSTPEEVAAEAIPDDALVNVIDLRERQQLPVEPSSPDLTAA